MKVDLVTGRDVPDESKRVPLLTYPNARPAEWPRADYIVGNPPFLGKLKVRQDLGDGYAGALRAAYPAVPESADFVMYWWEKAALLASSGDVHRFGLITTNSLRQTFNRRIVQQHLGKLSLVFAVPDHPWVDTVEGAAVRIAMTVGVAGAHPGELRTATDEEPHDDGSSVVAFAVQTGRIASDLTTGADLTTTDPLNSNEGLTSMGVMLAGRGFVVDAEEVVALVQKYPNIAGTVLRPLSNGKDLLDESRGAWVIDFTGLSVEEARNQHPELFQIVLTRVKPERDGNRDAQFKAKWWLFGRWRQEFRDMTRGLPRYIAAVETAKHRVFHFLDASVLPEHSLIGFGLDDAFFFGVLSSRIHVVFALAAGGRLGVGNDPRYNKPRCFDPFPFPACDEAAKARIRGLGEELDAHRKRVQAQHPGLTLTGMYNVLEALRAGRALTPKEQATHEQGLVSVLRQLHDELDAAVAAAYGWSDLWELRKEARGGGIYDFKTQTTMQLSASPERFAAALAAFERELDQEILRRLVAFSAERAVEEGAGTIRWLRPDYQNPTGASAEQGGLALKKGKAEAKAKISKAKAPWPKTLAERVRVVDEALKLVPAPVTAEILAKRFARAKPEDMAEILETLATLGRAQRDGENYTA